MIYLGGRAGERCGRPTKSGRPCVGARVPVLHYVFPSCRSHMTELERLTRDAMLVMHQVGETARHRAVEPACWSWPLPDYLVEPDDLGAVADWQDDRCAICGSRRELVEDHDHDGGLTRGWLCRSCNAREALHGPDEWVFARYRQRHPASMLGVRARYVSPFGLDASLAYDVARLIAEG